IVEVTANSQVDDPVVEGMIVYVRSWNEQALLDDILQALAADCPLVEKLELFVSVMAAETLASVGAVLYEPERGAFTKAVASPALDGALGADPVHADGPWNEVLATGTERLVAVDDLPPSLRQLARDRGYVWCWAYPVFGGEGGTEACLVMWRL